MNVEVMFVLQGNMPNGVEVRLPDWSTGGYRQCVELSMYEAIELRDKLVERFGPGR